MKNNLVSTWQRNEKGGEFRRLEIAPLKIYEITAKNLQSVITAILAVAALKRKKENDRVRRFESSKALQIGAGASSRGRKAI